MNEIREQLWSLSLASLIVGVLVPLVLWIVHGKDDAVALIVYCVPLVVLGIGGLIAFRKRTHLNAS